MNGHAVAPKPYTDSPTELVPVGQAQMPTELSPEGVEHYLATTEAWNRALPVLLRLGLSKVDNSSLIDFAGTPYLEGRPGGAPALAAALGMSVRFLRNERNERVYRIDDLGDGDYTVEVEIEVDWNVCGQIRTIAESGHSGTLKKFWIGDGEKIKHRYHEYLSAVLGVSQTNEEKFRAAMDAAMPQQIIKAKRMLLADIKKQAVANAWSRGVTRCLGIKLTWAFLETLGFSRDKAGAQAAFDGRQFKCPKCGKGTMRKVARKDGSGFFYGCSRFRDGCKHVMPVEEVEVQEAPPAPTAANGEAPAPTSATITKDLADDLKARWEAVGLKASDLSAHMKEIGVAKLGEMTPAQWREAVEKAYVHAVNKNPSMGRSDADEHMESEFKKKHPADLPLEKFRDLVGWIGSQII